MTSRPSQHDGEREDAGHLTVDELSAFINGDPDDAADREQVMAHLDECADCQERLSELRAVVRLLHHVESPALTRSFKLTAEMVGPTPVEMDPWIIRVQPALRRLTAIAAALLLIIVVADGLAHSGSFGSSSPKSVAESFSTSAGESAGGSTSQSLAVAAAATAAAASTARDSAAAVSTESQAVTSADVAATPTGAAVQAGSSATHQAEPPVVASQSTKAHTSYWRLAELAAGVVVIWLLFVTVALPRLRARREA